MCSCEELCSKVMRHPSRISHGSACPAISSSLDALFPSLKSSSSLSSGFSLVMCSFFAYRSQNSVSVHKIVNLKFSILRPTLQQQDILLTFSDLGLRVCKKQSDGEWILITSNSNQKSLTLKLLQSR